MTDKDLKKLGKSELLEVLLVLRQELDEANDTIASLRFELTQAKAKAQHDNEMMELLRATSQKVDIFCDWLLNEEGSVSEDE